MPAIFELVARRRAAGPGREGGRLRRRRRAALDRVAIVLIVTYVAGLLFSLKTHRDLFNPEHGGEEHDGEPWTVRKSVLMLAGAGVAVGVMSEILVGSISEASETIGLSSSSSA